VLSPAVLADPRGPKVDVATEDLFWPSGTVRVAGREYNAMILSACFLGGAGGRQITCTSCHSMHASDPDDMLRRDQSAQGSCPSCHQMAADHSRHRPGSPGASCVACHMPKTSYALRSAIRSHRIVRPDPSAESGEPNACNLCHLDRSLAWTVRTLKAWRGGGEVPSALTEIPESVKGLLTRDAAERVIWADAMGDPVAIATSGATWESSVLAYAADHDPYAVVRYVAERSRRKVESLSSAERGPATHGAPAVALTNEEILTLARSRDDRDVTVAE
jgi:predicted CXXCH cytochrome family protein